MKRTLNYTEVASPGLLVGAPKPRYNKKREWNGKERAAKHLSGSTGPSSTNRHLIERQIDARDGKSSHRCAAVKSLRVAAALNAPPRR